MTASGLGKNKIITGALPNTNEVADSFVSLVCIPAAIPSLTSSYTVATSVPLVAPSDVVALRKKETVDCRGVDKRRLRISEAASRNDARDAAS